MTNCILRTVDIRIPTNGVLMLEIKNKDPMRSVRYAREQHFPDGYSILWGCVITDLKHAIGRIMDTYPYVPYEDLEIMLNNLP